MRKKLYLAAFLLLIPAMCEASSFFWFAILNKPSQSATSDVTFQGAPVTIQGGSVTW